MNIKHYLSAVAALGLLAACSEYDPGMSDQAIDLTDAEIETIEEYRANFIARYGEPAEGHTWGFGAKGSEDEMGTRAVVSDNNSNQWGKAVGGDQYAYITAIPGYPHVTDNSTSPYNGKYEVKNGVTYSLKTGNQLTDSDIPVGDVTEEEILYVSEWFRSHQLSDGGTCPYTDFFVQDVSADVDIKNYPTWKDGAAYTNVENLADRTGMDDTPSYPYDSEHKSELTSAVFKLDQLCMTDQQTDVLPTESVHHDEIWNHPLNFNNGSTNVRPLASDAANSGRTLTHVKSTNPPVDFVCHNSDDSQYYNHWTMQHLTFVGPSGKKYDGYYLGFDYEYHKDGINKERDGYYNNWIVKISPSNPESYQDHKWNRIMCEDLGNTDDYDFNDLVYDVYFTGTNNQYTAHIKVLASGGTLPIYVGTHTEKPEREAHQILQGGNAKKLNGGQLYQPVNVSAGVTANPVEFEFEMKDASGNWLTGDAGTDPDNIPILVTSTDKSRQTASDKNTFVLLPAKKNPVPQKICIDGNLIDATKVRWMKERKQIESTYTLFDKWVTAGDKDNSEYHFGKTSDWTNHGLKNTDNLQ